MKILLDTHFIIWISEGADRLSPSARAAIQDDRSEFHVSAASFWEISIKRAKGKLASLIAPSLLAEAMERGGAHHLDVTQDHANAILKVPPPTSDPFDRLLLAQCQVEGMHLMTADASLTGHPLALKM
jgi:PIN domain nuclease of toxin-antitoxin system